MKKLYNLRLQTLIVLVLMIKHSVAFGAVPVITSFSPTSGAVGTTVTITGSNFNTTLADNVVFFGATKASVSTATSTSLSVVVPNGATYQPISVTDSSTGLTAYSVKPFVTTFAGSNAFDSYSFAPKKDFLTETDPSSVSIRDLDGDGKPDLAIPNYYSSCVSVFRNTSNIDTIKFIKVNVTTGSYPFWILIGDLDGDGKPDMVVSGSNIISVFRNKSTIGNILFAAKTDYTTGTDPHGIALGDLDGDGKPDLAVTNNNSNTVSVFHNTSNKDTISFAAKVDYNTGLNPFGVSICDLDGDKIPDLVVTNSKSTSVSVYRNTSTAGSISFATRVNFATGPDPYSISVGDLDGDGMTDLAITNINGPTISILRNTSSIGTISFAAKVDYAAGTNPYKISIGDLDGDGKPDLAVTNNIPNTVSVFRNNCTSGSVSFSARTDYATGNVPIDVMIGDLNGDEKPDFVVINGWSYTVSVYKNVVKLAPTVTSFTPLSATSGDTVAITGTNLTGATVVKFGGTAAYSLTVLSPTSIKAVVNSGVSGSVSVYVPGGGTASLAGFTYTIPPAPTITSFTPTKAIKGATVAISGTDFIGTTVVSFGGTAATSYTIISDTNITAVVGNGATGSISVTTPGGTANLAGFTFLPPPTISSFTPTSDSVGATVTITGTNFNTTPSKNVVFFGAVKASVSAATATSLTVIVPVGATYQNLSVTDISTSLTTYADKPFITTFEGSNKFDASSFGPDAEYTCESGPYTLSIGDLDGDGKPDIAAPGYLTMNVSVFRNNSASGIISFEPRVDYTTGYNPMHLAIGDLNGDGKPELVVANSASNTISVFQNTSTSGTISFADKVDFNTGYKPFECIIADLNADGKPDVAVVNREDYTVSVLPNTSINGIISFAPRVNFATGIDPRKISVCDFDKDGKPDLAISNYGSNTVSILLNTSTGGIISFASKVDLTPGLGTVGVSTGDIDGDGKPDLVVTNYNSDTVSIYRNTCSVGVVSFAAKVDFTTGAGPNNVSVGDIDGDGKLDLAIADYNSNSISVLKNVSTIGVISFIARSDYANLTGPSCVLIGDIDGDKKPDLVESDYAISSVSVHRNRVLPAPTITSFIPLSATSGDTVAITGTNFNGSNAVSFGGTAAFSFTVVSPTTITAIVNSGSSGNISLSVPGGGTATLAGFTYNLPPAPTIKSFDPKGAIIGETVNIAGTNLIGTTAVSFGGTAAASFIIVSDTSIAAIVGAGTTGSISLTTPGGTVSLPGFTYLLGQTIAFGPIDTKTYGGSDFDPGATASSALAVIYSSSDTAIAKIVSNMVRLTGAGSCTIHANQEGDSLYAPAPQVSKTLTVNPKVISLTGVSANNKVYDGVTIATFSGGVLNGVIGSDVVSLIYGTGAFSDKNTGVDKTVTSTGFTLGGKNAGNYFISAQPSGLTATISAAPLSVTADNKTRMQGTTNPEFTISYSGFMNGETEAVLNTKPVAFSEADIFSVPGNYDIIVSGGSDINYSLTYNMGTLTVTPITSVPEASIEGYSIYPNPADDYLIIKSPHGGAAMVNLFDIYGRLIIQAKVVNEQFSLKALMPGIYYLKIDNNIYQIIKK